MVYIQGTAVLVWLQLKFRVNIPNKTVRSYAQITLRE
jgi:hypothetical protein